MLWKPHSGWTKVKWRDAEKGFQRELEFNVHDKVKKEVLSVFIGTQESFIRDLPDGESPTMPFITGNLHDSIVGVVSDNGMLVKASYANRCAVTTSTISGKQIYSPTSGGGRKRIIGHQEAWRAVYGMNGKYPRKIATTLVVAVPYAINPEVRGPHAGYLENLRLNFASAMDTEFRLAAQRHVIAWKGNVNDYIQLAYDQDDTRLVQIPRKRGRKKGSGGGYMGSAGGGMKMRP